MSFERCGACAHWDSEDGRVGLQRKYRGGVWGLCLRMTTDEADPAGSAPPRAEAYDFNDDSCAELMSRPDFGCTEWRPADECAGRKEK